MSSSGDRDCPARPEPSGTVHDPQSGGSGVMVNALVRGVVESNGVGNRRDLAWHVPTASKVS
jgi:hypothetical protein